MSEHPNDPDLRALFAAQRADDTRQAPPFAEMLSRARAEASTDEVSRARSARARHRLEWIGGLAAAAAIAALIVVPRLRDGDDAFEEAVRAFQNDPALGAWQSPTDVLLKLPGDGLLTTVPDIGTAQ